MFDLYSHPYRDALFRWYQAYRCVAGEHEALMITPDVRTLRLVLLLPVREDTSHRELQHLWMYRLLNMFPSIQVERVVAISPEESADLFEQGEALRSMESASRLEDFDILLAILDQPEDILRLLRILEQAKIPAKAEHRKKKPLLYGVGRLGSLLDGVSDADRMGHFNHADHVDDSEVARPSVLLGWLDAFLIGDPLTLLLTYAPRWQAQKQSKAAYELPTGAIPTASSWPIQLAIPAVDALSEQERALLWALGQWHLQGCAFCQDTLLRETADTTLSRLLQCFLDLLQPGPQTPAWERWELWLAQAHQAHRDAMSRPFGAIHRPTLARTKKAASAMQSKDGEVGSLRQSEGSEAGSRQAEDGEVGSLRQSEGSEVGSSRQAEDGEVGSSNAEDATAILFEKQRWKEALRALGLDGWLDRMMYRQDEWALCMAWDAYPSGLAGSQEQEEEAWYDSSIAFLPWMWRERMAQRHTRVPLDLLLGVPNRGPQEALAWARIGRKATQISKLYQRNGRVRLFVHS